MGKENIDFSIFKDPKYLAFKNSGSEAEKNWAAEIEMLTRRVDTEIDYVELGNGDKIAVRTRLSYAEIEHMDRLSIDSNKLMTEGNIEAANELVYEMYALISANPIITKDFLIQHKDSYSFEDMIALVQGYQKNIEKTVGDVRKFRKQ